MAKVKDKTNLKRQREFQARRKQKEEDRAELAARFAAAAPDGIGKHIKISLEVENGEPRLVWKPDDVGAKFINDFAATIPMQGDQKFPADLVLRELSLHIGKKLIGREYDWPKETDSG